MQQHTNDPKQTWRLASYVPAERRTSTTDRRKDEQRRPTPDRRREERRSLLSLLRF
jgi:hypothetical protein